MFDSLLQSLARLLDTADPAVLLLVALGVTLLEPVFPPLPSETILQLCAFSGARVGLSPVHLTAAGSVGSFVSLYGLYRLGRGALSAPILRFVGRRLPRLGERAADLFARYGYGILFLGRFLPGMRGPLCALAGVYGLRHGGTVVILAVTSVFWNALVIGVGFAAGRLWDGSPATLARGGLLLGAAMILLALAGAWINRRLLRGPDDAER